MGRNETIKSVLQVYNEVYTKTLKKESEKSEQQKQAEVQGVMYY